MPMKHQVSPPGLGELAKFNINLPGNYESITYPLYDDATYLAAGQANLQFFQTPRGQGGKTYADTNMEAAGMIASPNLFYMTGVELLFLPGINPSPAKQATGPMQFVNDVWVFYTSAAYLELKIGAKIYLEEAPLLKFPPSHRFAIEGAASDSTTPAAAQQEYALSAFAVGQPFEMSPFVLPPNQTLTFSLNWPGGAVALPSGVAGKVYATLNGYLYRPAQ